MLRILARVLILAAAVPDTRVWAASGSSQTAQQTQLISLGARPAGMGEAYTAVADDAQAITYNPAGLIQLSNSNFSLMYAKWFADTTVGSGAYATPLGNGTAGIGLRAIRSTDDIRAPLTGLKGGQFSDTDALLDLAYAHPFGRNLALGGTVKFAYEKLATVSAFGAGLDLGVLYRVSPKLNLGGAILNAGTPLKLETTGYLPPMAVRGGVAYRYEGEEKRGGANVLQLSADADVQPLDQRYALRLGFEYALAFGDYALAARAGYKLGASDLGAIAGVTAGLGVKGLVGSVKLSADLAYVPYGDLGSTVRVSFTGELGQVVEESTPAPTPKPVLAAAVTAGAVEGVSAAPQLGGRVELSWSPAKDFAAAGYHVLAGTSPDQLKQITEQPVATTRATLEGLQPDVPYYLRVFAVSWAGQRSPESAVLKTSVPAADAMPRLKADPNASAQFVEAETAVSAGKTTAKIAGVLFPYNNGQKVARPGSKRPVAVSGGVEIGATEEVALGGDASSRLAKIAEIAKAHPDATVVLEGNSDVAGDDELNLDISYTRADMVRRALVSLYSLDRARITVVSNGRRKAQGDGATEEGRNRNRRVDATVTYAATAGEPKK